MLLLYTPALGECIGKIYSSPELWIVISHRKMNKKHRNESEIENRKHKSGGEIGSRKHSSFRKMKIVSFGNWWYNAEI